MKQRLFLPLFAPFLFLSHSFAQVTAPPELEEASQTSFSGFGTLGATYNSIGNEAAFLRTVNQEGDLRHFSARSDTRLGLQINHRMTPQVSLVGQVVLRDQFEHKLDDVISRAFIHWRVSPDWRFRFGRLGDSVYLMSDYQDTGYAYAWARPPSTTYSILPITHFDGAELSYTLPENIGGPAWRVKALIGRVHSDITLTGSRNYAYSLTSKGPVLGTALIRENESSKFWLGYASFKLANNNEASEFQQLQAGLNRFIHLPNIPFLGNPFDSEARALLEELSYENKRLGYLSAGFHYDEGRWMLQGEISKMSSSSRPFQAKQAYVSAGYHFGNLMPFALVGTIRGADPLKAQTNLTNIHPELSPPPLQPIIGAYQANAAALQSLGISGVNSSIANQDHFALGARWDFHPQAALKFQWDRFHIKQNGWMLWRPKDFSIQEKSAWANVFSFNLDFVF